MLFETEKQNWNLNYLERSATLLKHLVGCILLEREVISFLSISFKLFLEELNLLQLLT